MSTQTPNRPAPVNDDPDRAGASRGPTLLKVGLPLAVVGVLALLDPQATRAVLTATASSPRALAIVAGVVAATVGLSALLRTVVPNEWARAVLVLVPLTIVGGLYIAPYYGEGAVVDDAFPVALGTGNGDAPDGVADIEAVTVDPAELPTQGAPGSSTSTPAEVTSAPDDLTQAPADEPDAVASPAAVVEPTEAADPAAPIELSRGSFVGLDGHFANGQAALYDLGGGAQLVRLEAVDLQQVPEPFVYLVPAADATAPTADSVGLGPLKGTQGNQNYDVPADVDVSTGTWTVLVWCEPFSSPVGAASLS